MSIYDIVGVPFGYLMRIIYKICGNYPVSIILFTVVANLIGGMIFYFVDKKIFKEIKCETQD